MSDKAEPIDLHDEELCGYLVKRLETLGEFVLFAYDPNAQTAAHATPAVILDEDGNESSEPLIIVFLKDKKYLMDQELLAHELQHVEDMLSGKLDYDPETRTVYWDNEPYKRIYNPTHGWFSYIMYFTLPWEIQAFKTQHKQSGSKYPFWLWYIKYIIKNK